MLGVSLGPEVFLHVYAQQFQELSKSEAVSSLQGFVATRYYLVCHAIELALKAFLSYNGIPTSELALTYRHNLRRLHCKAKALNLARFVLLTNVGVDREGA